MHVFFDIFGSYIQPSDTIILAVSGGVDSMVLFDLARKYHPKERIIVAHMDHSLRGASSDGDRELVASICDREDIVLEVRKIDIGVLARDEKGSLESVARRERYDFLEDIRKKYNARYILTAHHRDDQMETILMGLMKGGKVRGLSGMPLISGCILRPLLGIPKSDILAYAHANGVIFREDATNMDETFLRNRIRHTLIPTLREIERSIDTMFSDLGNYMQELHVFLSRQVEDWLNVESAKSGKEHTFLIPDFVSESVFFQREIISTLYARAHGGSTQGLSHGNIEECIRFITLASNSHGVKEIKKLRLERRGERVHYIL